MSLPTGVQFFACGGVEVKRGRVYEPELIQLVEDLAKWLLPGWTISLMDEPPEWDPDPEHYWAVCDYGDNNRDLRIYLTGRLLDEEPQMIRRTLIHEMLHPHFRELRYANGIREDQDDEVWNHHEEIIVETMTQFIMDAGPYQTEIVGFG